MANVTQLTEIKSQTKRQKTDTAEMIRKIDAQTLAPKTMDEYAAEKKYGNDDKRMLPSPTTVTEPTDSDLQDCTIKEPADIGTTDSTTEILLKDRC